MTTTSGAGSSSATEILARTAEQLAIIESALDKTNTTGAQQYQTGAQQAPAGARGQQAQPGTDQGLNYGSNTTNRGPINFSQNRNTATNPQSYDQQSASTSQQATTAHTQSQGNPTASSYEHMPSSTYDSSNPYDQTYGQPTAPQYEQSTRYETPDGDYSQYEARRTAPLELMPETPYDRQASYNQSYGSPSAPPLDQMPENSYETSSYDQPYGSPSAPPLDQMPENSYETSSYDQPYGSPSAPPLDQMPGATTYDSSNPYDRTYGSPTAPVYEQATTYEQPSFDASTQYGSPTAPQYEDMTSPDSPYENITQGDYSKDDSYSAIPGMSDGSNGSKPGGGTSMSLQDSNVNFYGQGITGTYGAAWAEDYAKEEYGFHHGDHVVTSDLQATSAEEINYYNEDTGELVLQANAGAGAYGQVAVTDDNGNYVQANGSASASAGVSMSSYVNRENGMRTTNTGLGGGFDAAAGVGWGNDEQSGSADISATADFNVEGTVTTTEDGVPTHLSGNVGGDLGVEASATDSRVTDVGSSSTTLTGGADIGAGAGGELGVRADGTFVAGFDLDAGPVGFGLTMAVDTGEVGRTAKAIDQDWQDGNYGAAITDSIDLGLDILETVPVLGNGVAMGRDIAAGYEGMVNEFAEGDIIGGIGKLADGYLDAAENIPFLGDGIAAVRSHLYDYGDQFMDGTKEAWNDFTDDVGTAYNAVSDFTKDSMKAAEEFQQDVANGIVDTLSDGAQAYVDLGKDIVEGVEDVADEVQDFAEDAGDAVVDAGNDVVDEVSSWF